MTCSEKKIREREGVTVIGAGPSGLLATKALNETGCDVALIDKKDDLTKAGRACGNTILPPIIIRQFATSGVT